MKQSLNHKVGLGLRFTHFDSILNNKPQTPWFEVITDDFLNEGPHHKKLLKLRQSTPIAFHSIGLNIGGVDPFNKDYLAKFKQLYKVYEPAWISDHLCWSAHNGNYHHDLLPIPKTMEALNSTCARIQYLQDYFGLNLAIENITSYIDYKNETFTEIEFLKAIIKRTGCKLLLDISNVIINYKNRGQDPEDYFSEFPISEVIQVHLSGGTFDENTFIDSHSESVNIFDIEILKKLITKGLKASYMIERDANLPSFATLENERQQITEAISDIL